MKRLFTLTMALSLLFSLSHAQLLGGGNDGATMVNKNGYTILPEKGDIGFAVDASPFLNFAVNAVKINSGSTYSGGLHMQHPIDAGGNTFCIKYFTGDKTALRARFRIAYSGETTKYEVQDDVAILTNPDADPLIDKVTTSYVNFDVGLGMEKRRGSSRLQGIYGAEGLLYYSRGDVGSPNYTAKYANEITTTNTNPSDAGVLPTPPTTGGRYLKIKQNPDIGIGGRAFVGAEYFFTPKIAVGGELGVSLFIAKEGKSVAKWEYWNGTTSALVEDEQKSKDGATTTFNLDNETDSHIYLLLCF